MSGYRIVPTQGLDMLGEGPLWSARSNRLWRVDIVGQKVRAIDIDTHEAQDWAMPEKVGWVIERQGRDDLLAGLASGVVELALDPLRIVPLVSPEPDRPHNRLNDAKVDAAGRLWFGSKDDRDQDASGALYRLDTGSAVQRMDDGYQVTNGPTFSPDGRWLYHNDSGRRLVYRFALAADGTLGERGTFITFADDWGYPDGMTTDAQGCLWIAHWGGARVSRFDPDGALIESWPLPAANITSCAFAGAGLDRLFVTSAALDSPGGAADGALFEIDPGVTGIAPTPFAG
jgi:sugar lactone lactonase YvrE